MTATPTTVFINGRFLTQSISGVQRYAQEIVGALDALAGEGALVQRYMLLTPPGARVLDLRHIETRTVGTRNGHLWDQLDFARAVRGGVALGLAMTGPVAMKRQVVVIHDASVQRHPEHYSRPYVLAHRIIDRLLARRAVVATVSEFSRRELADVLPVAARDIVVAPNGAEHLSIAPDAGVVERLGLTKNGYFLTLGNLTRNKNLAVVLRALARLQPGSAKLVAVGRMERTVFGSAGLPEPGADVLLPGRLDDAEVAGLMQGARALIFPSIYEGFGIPPLEAFVNECPVLASTAPAVQEVCGDAADYFEPHDDATLARLMQMLLDDHDGALRRDRLAKGKQRVARYTWRGSAQILADACAKVAAR
ncbi:glycosyltransferase involved in cell wall biosynthesis [Sphingomonas endophytica]|uniref:Glycosyltransferase involved in cell wall biosynthesis n=1 Tax=Sphingomonas endophytica TaxID=869719 RepID=A0A7X0JEK9_9SPHN|nr:glycosyltransferase family 1 protein [Sphingomonas endophytica]MBB6506183.1 glycosyltransferase involved in cell wall biosynthesis [Sphingomonas endophytica]